MPWYLQYLGEKYKDKDFLLISILHLLTVNFPSIWFPSTMCICCSPFFQQWYLNHQLLPMTRASEVDCSSLEKRTIPILRLCLPKISNKSLEIGWFTWLWKDQVLFCGLQPHDWELILGKKWSSRYVWETVEERQCLNLVSLTQSCEKGKVVGFMK